MLFHTVSKEPPIRPLLVESLVIVTFYVISLMRYKVIVNY